MNMPNDFFARRLAAIEEERGRRLPSIEDKKTARAHSDRFSRVTTLVLHCIEKMRVAEFSEKEIADLLRAAADALDANGKAASS